MVEIISFEEFEKRVLDGNENALVDCYADWCMPCRVFSAVIEQVEPEFKGKVKFYKINVDKNPQILKQYGIQGIPTSLLFISGKLVDRFTGIISADELKRTIEQRLGE